MRTSCHRRSPLVFSIFHDRIFCTADERNDVTFSELLSILHWAYLRWDQSQDEGENILAPLVHACVHTLFWGKKPLKSSWEDENITGTICAWKASTRRIHNSSTTGRRRRSIFFLLSFLSSLLSCFFYFLKKKHFFFSFCERLRQVRLDRNNFLGRLERIELSNFSLLV